MNRLRRRLVLMFLAATLVPLGATLWVAHTLLERSLRFSSTLELDELSRTLESTARQFYQREREALRREVSQGTVHPVRLPLLERRLWPAHVEQFWQSGEPEHFALGGASGDTLHLLQRRDDHVIDYARHLGGVEMGSVRRQLAKSRQLVDDARARDLRRGFFSVLVLLAAVPWLAALALLVFSAHRISKVALDAYNRMAEELQQSRERLLYLTRLESWQALARKTAHEVKNSLTPIRLMMEELAARHRDAESFENKAAQVIVDEVNSLERRVRAFSEFAAEPPVRLRPLDANSLVEERIAFLRAAHPQVQYEVRLQGAARQVLADEDLLKGLLTNLLENAAQAAGPEGRVLACTRPEEGLVAIEVHDSGPGLSPSAEGTLFEPTISFKKGGMGLGLSIARKSAVLCGGDIVLVKGELGGAGFRVVLSPAA